MATIHEVYDRLLWDTRLDRSAFAIGYIEFLLDLDIQPFHEQKCDRPSL
jgi:hypothetical protein